MSSSVKSSPGGVFFLGLEFLPGEVEEHADLAVAGGFHQGEAEVARRWAWAWRMMCSRTMTSCGLVAGEEQGVFEGAAVEKKIAKQAQGIGLVRCCEMDWGGAGLACPCGLVVTCAWVDGESAQAAGVCGGMENLWVKKKCAPLYI